MLSFLIGLVLLLSTVQNNCNGANATLQEQMEIIKAMPPGGQGGKGTPTPCTTVSECPQGYGCFSQNNQGGCLECSMASQAASQPGITVDGCSSGGGGNATTCTSDSQCPSKNGCLLPSGSSQGTCLDCSLTPTLAGQPGVTIIGCGSSGNGTGNPGNASLNCESASDCKGQAGGPYGCGKIPGASNKMCIACEVVNQDPTGVLLSADGCSQGQGLRLNTM